MTKYVMHAEVFDGRGIAEIWIGRDTRAGFRDGEHIGTVYGVHTVAEAIAAARADAAIAARYAARVTPA